jgi:hypothetical protein
MMVSMLNASNLPVSLKINWSRSFIPMKQSLWPTGFASGIAARVYTLRPIVLDDLTPFRLSKFHNPIKQEINFETQTLSYVCYSISFVSCGD